MVNIVVKTCSVHPHGFRSPSRHMWIICCCPFIARWAYVMSFVYELCAKVKYITSRLQRVTAGTAFISLSLVPYNYEAMLKWRGYHIQAVWITERLHGILHTREIHFLCQEIEIWTLLAQHMLNLILTINILQTKRYAYF